MAQIRKPIPKTSNEAVKETLQPYDLAGMGHMSPTIPDNRATKVSAKDNRDKNFSVGLMDIDGSVLEYMKNTIKPQVYQNDQLLDVPVIYAYPERWTAIQKDGYLRDETGRMLTPIIAINRTNVTKNRNLTNKVDGNYPHNFQLIEIPYTRKNAYDSFEVINNRIPVKQRKAVVVPDYVTVTYECYIFTNYVEQINKVIEAIQYSEGSYWGDPRRFQFRVNIDSFPTVTSFAQGEDRTIRSTLQLSLHGYLLPDTVNRYLAADLNVNTKAQIKLTEKTLNSEEMASIGNTSNTIRSGKVSANTDAVYRYLNASFLKKDPVIVSGTSFRFDGTSVLQAPEGFTPTGVQHFNVFVNGVNENGSVISLSATPNSITFNLDSATLGYSLSSTDSIVVVGKFSK